MTAPAPPSPSAVPPRSRRIRTFLQVGALLAIWFGLDRVTATLGWSVSPGVLGLLALLGLLLWGKVDVVWVKDGAGWLLQELVLFFIPSVVAVIKYAPLFRVEGVRLVIAIVAGTVLVMAATALAVHAGCCVEARLSRSGQKG